MIKMIRGVFGLPVDGIVKAMDKNSGPFEAGAEQEARLIRLGLAVRVGVENTSPVEEYAEPMDEISPIGFDETPPVPESADEIPEYSEAMKASDLRELGAMFGLSFKVGMSKKDMVAALDDYFDLSDAVEPMEDGELAPSFDAAEAVQ
jgi:hypothetical protein